MCGESEVPADKQRLELTPTSFYQLGPSSNLLPSYSHHHSLSACAKQHVSNYHTMRDIMHKQYLRCNIFSFRPLEAPTRMTFSVRQRRWLGVSFLTKKWKVASFHFHESTWRRGLDGEFKATVYGEVTNLKKLLSLDADLPVRVKSRVEGRVKKEFLKEKLGDLLKQLQTEDCLASPTPQTLSTSDEVEVKESMAFVTPFEDCIEEEEDIYHSCLSLVEPNQSRSTSCKEGNQQELRPADQQQSVDTESIDLPVLKQTTSAHHRSSSLQVLMKFGLYVLVAWLFWGGKYRLANILLAMMV